MYLFSSGDIQNTRSFGVPKLTTKLRTSFHPELKWLDDAMWDDRGGQSIRTKGGIVFHPSSSSEVQDGHCLLTIEKQRLVFQSYHVVLTFQTVSPS